MQDIIRLFLSYAVGVWRYRWVIVLVPALVSPVGWFFVATLPDEFEASAKVFVDTDSVLTPLMRDIAVRIDDRRRIGMMTKLLFSRQILDKLARMTDQDLKANTPQEMDDLIESLKERVKLEREGDNIYRLAFTDESPDLAKRVVQSFLTIFVETNLGESRKDQDSAEQFVLREAKEYERRLLESERKMKEFKARNLPYISDKGGYFSDLQNIRTQLENVTLEYQMAEERNRELEDQLLEMESSDSYEDDMEDDGGLGSDPMSEQLAELQEKIDSLLIRYTERHPEVTALRRMQASLQAQIDASMVAEEDEHDEDEDASGVNRALAKNPVYQQLKLLQSEAQADMASRRAIVKEYTRRIELLQKEVDRVLQVEAENKQLARDYVILTKKHGAMLERLESLRLGREVDSSADTVRFRTLEPPKVPDKPIGPNRILFSTMVFLGSLSLGFAIAVVISLFRLTYSDRKQLNESTGIPVLGSVNMVWTDAERRKRRVLNMAYMFSFMMLLLSFVAVLVVYQFNIDVLDKLPLL